MAWCLQLAVILAAADCLPEQAANLELVKGTAVEFLGESQAALELKRTDSFILSLSQFDRSSRMKTDRAVGQDEFLSFVSSQARPWRDDEVKRLTAIINSITPKISALGLKLPAGIGLVKTTGDEEGHAAYCRGNSTVILPTNMIAGSDRELERTLTHELFHIVTRNDTKLRDALYTVIGFKPCGIIRFPLELMSRKITNPDAPINSHYIDVDSEGRPVQVVPILISSKPTYDVKKGGDFFAYLVFQLMVLEEKDWHWKPAYQEGKVWLLNPNQVGNFREQIGRNTNYIIHPEEILADNFVILVEGDKPIPTPEIVDQMRQVFSKFSVNQPQASL